MEGRIEPLHRRDQRLVDAERRRRARIRVPADDYADERLLARTQPFPTRPPAFDYQPSFTDLKYVPNGKLGPQSIHPAQPPPPNGPQGLPLIKPPYTRMTAYDLNTGTIAWQVPTGPGPGSVRNHPALKGVNLPALGGQGGQGGPLITKTLLVYALMAAGRNDSATLVAYDKATGATLGEVALPAAPLGTPMTFAIAGRQFIAVTLTNGTMVSLALPKT